MASSTKSRLEGLGKGTTALTWGRGVVRNLAVELIAAYFTDNFADDREDRSLVLRVGDENEFSTG